jgi:hypothetical protein
MAKVSQRRGRYVVDYRDLDRVRRWESFTTRQAADKRLKEVLEGVHNQTFGRLLTFMWVEGGADGA